MMSSLGHYTELARQLPTAALLRAFGRRAQGIARRAAWLKAGGVALSDVLASHGVTEVAALVGAALDAREGGAWCDVARREDVLAAVERVPGCRERALARAEAAANGEYDVFGVKLRFGHGAPIEWGLDAISGHRYPLVPVEALELNPVGADPKAPWVLGRLDDLLALAQGAWAARDESERRRFVASAIARLTDFLRNNPVGTGIQWASPMEVALRAANLAQAVVMLSDREELREPSLVGQIVTALASHLDYVAAHLEDTSAVPNNHLLANLTGLWVVHLLFPLLPGATGHLARARLALREETARQVHEEGTSFEGSVPYHRLSLEMLTLCELAARSHSLRLGEVFSGRLQAMFRVARQLVSERGRAPQLGDNDSGRVFPFAVRDSLDFSYLAPLGAALFNDGVLKRERDVFPDEAVWLLGQGGLRRFEALAPAGEERSSSFPQGGWHVLKGAGAHVVVSAGRTGQRGVGGHSHNDALSFELHLAGAPLIVDPGSVTYTREPALRNALRATAAHNTVEIDGAEINPIDPERLFALPDRSRARVEVFHRGDGVERLVCSHEGYRRLEGGGTVERAFLLDKRERALSIVDSFDGRGLHTLTTRLHLGNTDVQLLPLPEAVAARMRRVPEAPRSFAPLSVRFSAGGQHAFLVLEAGPTLVVEDGCFSAGYGLLAPAKVVVWRNEVSGPARQRWAVAFG